ncbi:helix-turn-helix domain-containing protein [Streptomyces benahoarensis]|uniref:Helix-turn-helix domain-containing protein n=1 Tax=Streptomyces benahoarensis TaxID=2595054 RepID=A0A553ZGT1_9ACTN|nr:helix-turn-helix domain-containing protein [Streptomyces benahoarensis]TSB13025.1 helix-turn-helix domain-containing protein [Streptomyces benahoarensis]TSB40681.1 helix-turn-helix domain-containing protein [Streptomyces benahoarensis]
MAEQKTSAAARPQHRVRRTTTRIGVTHIRAHQTDRYTIIGNHLAQHRELSLVAIGVATHILSLPEGAAVDIRTLADRFPEGRDRIAFALRELEAHGYVERVRERVPGGRFVTRTYAFHAPDLGRAAGGEPGCVREAGEARVRESREAGETREEKPPPPAPAEPRPVRSVSPVPRAPPPAAEVPGGERHDAATALLVGLRRTDDRLTLPGREVRRLVPAVLTWLDNGATAAAVHRTLTADLPADLKHPAGLLAHRLRELLPPPLPAPAGPAAGEPPGAPLRPLPFQTCDGCERAFRGRAPGLCRDCGEGADCRGGPVACGTAAAA